MISIGNLAKTYNVLPSRVLAEATTFDLMITDVMMTWEKHKENPADISMYKEEDLLAMVQRTKS